MTHQEHIDFLENLKNFVDEWAWETLDDIKESIFRLQGLDDE